MVGVHRQHQPVQKPPPVARWTRKQPVKGGRQPDQPQMIGKGAGRGHAHPVDPAAPSGGLAACGLVARAQTPAVAIGFIETERQGKAARRPVAGHIAELDPPQTAAGGEER